MVKIPEIQVGIMSDSDVEFSFQGSFITPCGKVIDGSWDAEIRGENIEINDGFRILVLRSGAIFKPMEEKGCSFTLKNVLIGIDLHWERNEDQIFKGALKLLVEDEKISVVNILPLEDYLVSVISSEMSTTSSLELLKAHAVISRSWSLAQIEKNKKKEIEKTDYSTGFYTEEEHIKWYNRAGHVNFDVCADDHCQRYQGITRSTTKLGEIAVKETEGTVLMNGEEVCDARFSKSCGGMSEEFENVWEPVKHPYLQSFVDLDYTPKGFELDLTNEELAREWILGDPEAFCNTQDIDILSQVLNDYDQKMHDFYRWEVTYSQEELSELIKRKLNIDFGLIQDLIPIERGKSGRLIKLRIVGEKKTLTIGKELEIRKALSKTHLYSSAFIIERILKDDDVLFRLKGAGWGHGVGLCQIGAAMMSAKGYLYNQILMHYFRGAELKKLY